MRTILPNILSKGQGTKLTQLPPNKSNTIWDRPEIKESAGISQITPYKPQQWEKVSDSKNIRNIG
jgi:hypothetical protein